MAEKAALEQTFVLDHVFFLLRATLCMQVYTVEGVDYSVRVSNCWGKQEGNLNAGWSEFGVKGDVVLMRLECCGTKSAELWRCVAWQFQTWLLAEWWSWCWSFWCWCEFFRSACCKTSITRPGEHGFKTQAVELWDSYRLCQRDHFSLHIPRSSRICVLWLCKYLMLRAIYTCCSSGSILREVGGDVCIVRWEVDRPHARNQIRSRTATSREK